MINKLICKIFGHDMELLFNGSRIGLFENNVILEKECKRCGAYSKTSLTGGNFILSGFNLSASQLSNQSYNPLTPDPNQLTAQSSSPSTPDSHLKPPQT